MKNIYAKDIKTGVDINDEIFGVKSLKRALTKDGKPFCDVTLVDKTGQVRGKIWSDSLEACDGVTEGDVVRIFGKVSNFNGSPQITISAMATTEDYDQADIVPSSEHNISDMLGQLNKVILDIRDPHLKKLLSKIFDDDFLAKYSVAPAAYTIHHAYKGGLLEHTLDIVEMAEALCKRYTKINKDLLITGAILHDVGKMTEYEMETTISMTTKGKLLGHIYLGTEFVQQKAPKDMPDELLSEVLHMILSHQGSQEFGSPVVPKTPEAIALSALDDVSFKINTVYHAVHNSEFEGEFSPFQRHLGTDLYRSSYLSNEEDNL